MRSGVPSSRITRAEPSICIVSRSNGSLSQQISRPAVDRDIEFGTGKARARNNRLEIAGQQPRDLAQARDANGLKVPFEEGAGGIRIPWPQAHGVAANVP